MSSKLITTTLCAVISAISIGASVAEAGQRFDKLLSGPALEGARMKKVCVEWGPKPSPDAFAGPCVRWEYRLDKGGSRIN